MRWEDVDATYGDLFRRGSDLSGLDWNSVDMALNLERPGGQAHAQGATLNYGQSSAGAAAQARTTDLPQPQPLAGAHGPLLQLATDRSAAELTQELRSRLRAQCGRSYRRVIDGLAVCVADSTTVIHCVTLADRLAVLDALMSALRWIVADLGLPRAIHVTNRPPNGLEPPGGGGQLTTGVPLSA